MGHAAVLERYCGRLHAIGMSTLRHSAALIDCVVAPGG
jgi:hypothetical protein